jgi:hypothetical protein
MNNGDQLCANSQFSACHLDAGVCVHGAAADRMARRLSGWRVVMRHIVDSPTSRTITKVTTRYAHSMCVFQVSGIDHRWDMPTAGTRYIHTRFQMSLPRHLDCLRHFIDLQIWRQVAKTQVLLILSHFEYHINSTTEYPFLPRNLLEHNTHGYSYETLQIEPV